MPGPKPADGNLEGTVTTYSANAFGQVTGGSAGGTNPDVGFTGASTADPKGGFTYMRNRWYDPQTGRFLTQDPIGLAGGVNLYSYAGNNPIAFSDPYGLCVPWCLVVAAYAAYEAVSSAYDIYQAGKTLADPNASAGKKAGTVALAAVGIVAPGGGYTALGKSLDNLADAAKAIDKGGELTKAGRALEKHGSRPGSAFAPATGNAAAKNAAGQQVVEDILTSPGSRTVPLTSGRFKGGTDIYAPDGRGVRYDSQGNFVGLLEPPK